MMTSNEYVEEAIENVPANSSDLEVRVDLPGVKVGIVEAAGIRAAGVAPELHQQMDVTCERLRNQHSWDSLRQWEPVHMVREVFRSWGMDPSKYRPSSEALLRRVIKGETLPTISTIVDIGNLGALEMGWPYGCYNREKISRFIEIRFGKSGEQYAGIGRQMMRMEGRPVFSDADGPFGSPVTDSSRTMVTDSTRNLLAIVCAPVNSCELKLEDAMSKFAERVVLWCGAENIQKRIVKGVAR